MANQPVVDLNRYRVAKDSPEPWVRIGSVAEHFGVSKRTVARWAARGMRQAAGRRLSSRMVGYRLSAVEAWLHAHEGPRASRGAPAAPSATVQRRQQSSVPRETPASSPKADGAASSSVSPAVELSPEAIEAIATRVVALLADEGEPTEGKPGWGSRPPRPPGYLNAAAAAGYLGCGKSRIYQLVHRRAIPFRKEGSRLLFKPSELDAWVLQGGGTLLPPPSKSGESPDPT